MNLVLKVALRHRLDTLIFKLHEGTMTRKEKKEAELLAELEQLYEN